MMTRARYQTLGLALCVASFLIAAGCLYGFAEWVSR
jgi:hypothetical protein